MNNLSPRTIEKMLIYLCLLAIFLIVGMGSLGLQGRENSVVFTAFDRLAILIVGGLIGFLKQPNG